MESNIKDIEIKFKKKENLIQLKKKILSKIKKLKKDVLKKF